jgi:hypothetical protein
VACSVCAHQLFMSVNAAWPAVPRHYLPDSRTVLEGAGRLEAWRFLDVPTGTPTGNVTR